MWTRGPVEFLSRKKVEEWIKGQFTVLLSLLDSVFVGFCSQDFFSDVSCQVSTSCP